MSSVDAALNGLDAARRAGWAKFYEAEREIEELRKQLAWAQEQWHGWVETSDVRLLWLVTWAFVDKTREERKRDLVEWLGTTADAAALVADRLRRLDFEPLAEWWLEAVASHSGEQPPPPHHPPT